MEANIILYGYSYIIHQVSSILSFPLMLAKIGYTFNGKVINHHFVLSQIYNVAKSL